MQAQEEFISLTILEVCKCQLIPFCVAVCLGQLTAKSGGDQGPQDKNWNRGEEKKILQQHCNAATEFAVLQMSDKKKKVQTNRNSNSNLIKAGNKREEALTHSLTHPTNRNKNSNIIEAGTKQHEEALTHPTPMATRGDQARCHCCRCRPGTPANWVSSK